MSIEQYKDVENGDIQASDDLVEPLVTTNKVVSDEESESDGGGENGSIAMVLLSTFVTVCGSFEFGSCVGYSAPTQAAIREDLGLSLAEYSTFGSILTIGAMLGAISSGRISDFIGRKGAMRMSAIFCITGWLAVFFSNGALSLDVGRFFTGYGIGVFSFVVPIFIAEIAPKNLRGGLTSLNQLMIVCGASVAFLIGTVITWRALALTGLVPCVVLLVGLFFVPESPRWLAKVGREKEFQVALQQLRGKHVDVSRKLQKSKFVSRICKVFPKLECWIYFRPSIFMPSLCAKNIANDVQIGVGLMVFQQFGGINGISFYASETFASAGPSVAKNGTIAYACVQVPITIVGAILMDKSGRRPLIMVSATGTFLGSFLAGLSFFFKAHAMLLEWVPLLTVAGVLVYIASFSIGMGAVPWVIMSEIFPIDIKGVAGSLVVLVNWLGAWAVSYTFNFLMSWSSSGTFFVYSGFSVMTILFVAKLAPETKGKTLEEIQASISSNRRGMQTLK